MVTWLRVSGPVGDVLTHCMTRGRETGRHTYILKTTSMSLHHYGLVL